jgi:2-oxoglutarate ferredoxin oxidoreductase subunit alpha
MYGAYTEVSKEYQEVVDRLRRKWETAKQYVPDPVVDYSEKNRVGIISIGSCDGAVVEARDHLTRTGVGLNYLRVKAFPFTDQVQEFLDAHDRIYVVEQNRDAQLHSLLLLETRVNPEKLIPLLYYNGLPISAGGVIESINADMAKGVAA